MEDEDTIDVFDDEMNEPSNQQQCDAMARKPFVVFFVCAAVMEALFIAVTCYYSWITGAFVAVLALLHLAFCWSARKLFMTFLVWYLASIVSLESGIVSRWARSASLDKGSWNKTRFGRSAG